LKLETVVNIQINLKKCEDKYNLSTREYYRKFESGEPGDDEENVWLPQKRIAQLFEVDRTVVTKHLRNIFASSKLDEDSVRASFAHTTEDGKTYQTKFYSLEAIIAVGYRVNSSRGTQFRQWAITILQQYIHKGFAIDSDRFKYGSRFSTRYFDDLLEEIRDIHGLPENYRHLCDVGL
jgi:hypothetical protein